jgi:L-lactate permease
MKIVTILLVIANAFLLSRILKEKGTFQANLNTSIKQMAAYAALLLSVAACVGSFIEQNGSSSATNSHNEGRP